MSALRISKAMPFPETYRWLRRNGDIFIGVALAGSLFSRHWATTTLSVYLGLLFLTSAFVSIWDSCGNFTPRLFRTSRGIYYNYKLFYAVVLFPLVWLHSDPLSGMETALKSVLVSYIVVMNVDRFRWPALIYGVSVGAIVAFGVGLFQIGIAGLPRAGGDTSPVQFGMMAMCLAAVAAVGFAHARGDRLMATFAATGFLCGVATAFISGSRGAVLALPFVLAPVAPVFLRRSRRAFLTVSASLAIFAGGLLLTDVGEMSSRIGIALSNVSLLLPGAKMPGLVADDGDPKLLVRRSDGERLQMIALAYRLFLKNPIFGVGTHGWNDAVETLAASPDPAERLRVPFNQAHNQYADDLAKGGILRFVLGLLLLGMPLWLFLKSKPYSNGERSGFALAGVVASSSFMIFCLSESLVLLSLPMIIHPILMFYLLAGCDGVGQPVATVPDASTPAMRPANTDRVGAMI
jgi:O-antigen ligase